jgi:flagellin
VKSNDTISTQTKASSLVATIQSSLTNVNAALAKLSAGAAKFSIQGTFAQKLSDTLTQGIGNLVDANMAQESAKLQALQVRQQLGIQALSIANQAPQTILSLFR